MPAFLDVFAHLNDLHDLDEFLFVDAAVLLEPDQDLIDGPRGLAQPDDLVPDGRRLDPEAFHGLVAFAVEEAADLGQGETHELQSDDLRSWSRSASV